MRNVFHKHILPCESPIQALIATKVVFDMVFSPISKKHKLTPILEAIGKALEAEAQMNYYENEAKGLFITLKKNYWHQARGTESKRKCIQTTMHKQHITPWVPSHSENKKSQSGHNWAHNTYVRPGPHHRSLCLFEH